MTFARVTQLVGLVLRLPVTADWAGKLLGRQQHQAAAAGVLQRRHGDAGRPWRLLRSDAALGIVIEPRPAGVMRQHDERMLSKREGIGGFMP